MANLWDKVPLEGYGAGNYNKLLPFCGRSFIEFWDEMMHTVHISRQASCVELDNIQGTARGRRFVSQKQTSKHASIAST
jgi:hypothetical protein